LYRSERKLPFDILRFIANQLYALFCPCGFIISTSVTNTTNLQVENTQLLKKKKPTRCKWLTLIILATQEAEIRRITVRSQPGHIIPQDPVSKNPSQK
jgi:hypothetical protein